MADTMMLSANSEASPNVFKEGMESNRTGGFSSAKAVFISVRLPLAGITGTHGLDALGLWCLLITVPASRVMFSAMLASHPRCVKT